MRVPSFHAFRAGRADSIPPSLNKLWSWGYNGTNSLATTYGQLGLGNLTNYSSPKQVGALTNWSVIAGGSSHTLAIKTDGTLWSWGSSFNGQLGLGNSTYYSSPKQVGALTAWAKISAGTNAAFSIKTNGTFWSWGRNTFGQLGDGTASNTDSPNQVGALTNWSFINTVDNAQSVSVIKTDGTLWSWGQGTSGQLGLGNTTNYSSPKQVGSLTTWVNVSNGSTNTVAIKTT